VRGALERVAHPTVDTNKRKESTTNLPIEGMNISFD